MQHTGERVQCSTRRHRFRESEASTTHTDHDRCTYYIAAPPSSAVKRQRVNALNAYPSGSTHRPTDPSTHERTLRLGPPPRERQSEQSMGSGFLSLQRRSSPPRPPRGIPNARPAQVPPRTPVDMLARARSSQRTLARPGPTRPSSDVTEPQRRALPQASSPAAGS